MAFVRVDDWAAPRVWDSYCTGTGDDQVFYYQGKDTTRFSGTIDFNIGLGPGDDRMTVLSRRSDFSS